MNKLAMNPFTTIVNSGAHSERVVARYCHLLLAAGDSKGTLLALVCESDDLINTLHDRSEIAEALDRESWPTMRQMAHRFLSQTGY